MPGAVEEARRLFKGELVRDIALAASRLATTKTEAMLALAQGAPGALGASPIRSIARRAHPLVGIAFPPGSIDPHPRDPSPPSFPR